MADTDCCQLVGNLQINLIGCVTSVSVSSSTELTDVCAELKAGPTIGNISIGGYATDAMHVGCPGQAGVSVPWLRRYDCEEDILYLIPNGHGQSYVAGDVEGLATLIRSLDRSYPIINASSQSGPTGIYMQTDRTDGYGLIYTGDIITFNTGDSMVFPNFGVGEGDMYLQNFSLNMNPGDIPTVSYSFMFVITD